MTMKNHVCICRRPCDTQCNLMNYFLRHLQPACQDVNNLKRAGFPRVVDVPSFPDIGAQECMGDCPSTSRRDGASTGSELRLPLQSNSRLV